MPICRFFRGELVRGRETGASAHAHNPHGDSRNLAAGIGPTQGMLEFARNANFSARQAFGRVDGCASRREAPQSLLGNGQPRLDCGEALAQKELRALGCNGCHPPRCRMRQMRRSLSRPGVPSATLDGQARGLRAERQGRQPSQLGWPSFNRHRCCCWEW